MFRYRTVVLVWLRLCEIEGRMFLETLKRKTGLGMRDHTVPPYTEQMFTLPPVPKHSYVFIIGSATNHVVNRCSCLLFSVRNVTCSNNVIAPTLVTVFVTETWIP